MGNHGCTRRLTIDPDGGVLPVRKRYANRRNARCDSLVADKAERRGMKNDSIRIIMGFSTLCCVNVVCFFPDALAPWASTEWLRTYNMYARPAECISLIAIAAFAFKIPRIIGAAGVGIGYGALFCGLCAPAVLGSAANAPAFAGMLCGIGLAPTMMFWFAFLTKLPERRQAIAQGWQALVGECLFLAVSFFFDAGIAPACILTAASAACALGANSDGLFAEDGETASSVRTFLNRGKTEWLASCAGYLIASLVYGALVALSRGAAGGAASETASSIGAPIGALFFIIWVKASRNRDYGNVSEWVVAASAAACLLPDSMTVLLFSAFFQITGLLLFSLFIDRLSTIPRAAVACIAIAYGISHLLFFFGLYLPGATGAAEGGQAASQKAAWLACAIGATAFIARTWRANARRVELEDRCRSYERVIEAQQGEIKRRDEESALLRAAAFDGGADREYDTACRLIAKERGLTKRETEILQLLVRGRDVSFICDELYLARNTVKGYTKRIYAKMDIHSKQEAIDAVRRLMARR